MFEMPWTRFDEKAHPVTLKTMWAFFPIKRTMITARIEK